MKQHKTIARIDLVVALFVAAAVCAAGAQSTYKPPRSADGKPDLQGVWDFSSLTPLERPKEMADRAFLTPEEAAAITAESAKRNAERNAPTERNGTLPAGGTVGAYNGYWVDQDARVAHDRRTSIIIDPPDGRLPPLKAGVRREVGSTQKDLPGVRPVHMRGAGIGADGAEDRGLAERCLVGFNSGPPVLPAGYNQNIQIVQTSDHVVILNEMVHDARIIPLDGRPHLPSHVRQWLGDGRGRWEGDTLVVETTNFTDKTASFNPAVAEAVGTGATLHLTERFRRVADDILSYEFTVDDPSTYTRPFTGVLSMRRGQDLYEFACHEANYGLGNILRGARVQDSLAQSEK
jgi:hypothetical protein